MLTDAGVHVTYCLVTDGDAGGSDRIDVTPRHGHVASSRADRAAAAQVGVTDLVFLGHGDGRVQPTLQLRADISAVIRRVRRRGGHHASRRSATSTASTPAIPITSPLPRRRCAPSIPTHATRSPSPSCSTRTSNHGRSTRCGSRRAVNGPNPVDVTAAGRSQDRRLDVPRQPAHRPATHRDDGSRVDDATSPSRSDCPTALLQRRFASSTPVSYHAVTTP